MSGRKEWNGSATELLEQLDEIIGDKASKNKYWPKIASVLSRRINEVKTNLQEVGIFIKEGPQDAITRVKTIVITKTQNIGKMPFEQFEPFDRRGEVESQNNAERQMTPNDSNDTNGNLRNSDGPAPENITSDDVSNEIDRTTTTTNDSNDTNGNLRNSDGPNKIVSNSCATSPILPPYVYRLGNSDKFACRLCNIRDDKWGMINHYHPEGEDKK